ncbi:bifunctional 3'-5' exonuclease/DNA polymerase, partial [Schumannella luteola]
MYVAVSSPGAGRVELVELDAELVETARFEVARAGLAAWAAERERGRPRWVWADTARWYPALLAGGVRIDRSVDLRLGRAILRNASATVATALARSPRDRWDASRSPDTAPSEALFELDEPQPDDDPVEELRRQRTAIAESTAPGRLALLTAADSVGALVAVEMQHAGLPWDPVRHDRILTELLGARTPGARPARMEALVARIRSALDDAEVNPDSPPALLKSLQRAGLRVRSTSRWELKGVDHPVVEPLLAYKKLARLYTANGWAWLDEWVHDGRFRPVYVPAGVVTGRWASDGGGALQLPQQVRGA